MVKFKKEKFVNNNKIIFLINKIIIEINLKLYIINLFSVIDKLLLLF